MNTIYTNFNQESKPLLGNNAQMAYQPPPMMEAGTSTPQSPHSAAEPVWARPSTKKPWACAATAVRIVLAILCLVGFILSCIFARDGPEGAAIPFLLFALIRNAAAIMPGSRIGPRASSTQSGFGCFIGNWRIIICGSDDDDELDMGARRKEDHKRAIWSLVVDIALAISLTVIASCIEAVSSRDPVGPMGLCIVGIYWCLIVFLLEDIVRSKHSDDDDKTRIHLPYHNNEIRNQNVSIAA